MKTLFHSTSPLVICLLVAGFTGCAQKSDAPKLAEAKGLVLYKEKPLANAQVLFTPQSGPMSMGETDAEGRFALTTGDKKGATIGSHRVTVTAFEPIQTPIQDEANAKPPVSRIPEKFGNLNQSGLTAEVKAGSPNEFTFELK